MVSEPMKYDIDLTKDTVVQSLKVPFVQADENAHTIVLNVLNDGVAAYMTGVSCSGAVVRPDDTVVGLSGVKDGNVVSVTIPPAAYNIVGRITIIIKLNTSTEKRTVLVLFAVVNEGGTGTVVESTTTLGTLNEILGNAQTIKTYLDENYADIRTKMATIEIATDEEAASYLGGD